MPARSPTIVGREREAGELARALAEARSGRGGALFIVGEAGVGKTRLALDAAVRAADQGMVVLRGRGGAIGPMVPYRPLTEALLALSRTWQPPSDGSLGPYWPVLGRLVPDWARPAADSTASPVILAEAVLRLTAAVGRSHGCLLLLDDLQDADAETLAVVDYLADNLGQQPTLLLATIRAEPSGPLTMAEDAVHRGAARTLALDRLDRPEVTEMIAACLGTAVDEVPKSVVDELWGSSAGLPFVVEELLHAMLSGGFLIGGPDGWTVVGTRRPGVPAGLVRHLAARVEQLGPSGRLVLLAAAVLGQRFPVSVLQRATGLDDHALVGTLRAGVTAQLVAPDDLTPDWYTFRHPLTAEGLLAQLIPTEHADLCRRAADAVEEVYPGLPGEWCVVAAALRLGAGAPAPAARLFVEAGRRALASGAASSAVSLLDRADRLLGEQHDVDLRADVLHSLLPALGEAGQFDRALEQVATIEQLVLAGLDHRRGADLHMLLARVACLAGRTEAAQAQLAAARERLGPHPAPAAAAAIDAVAALVALVLPGERHRAAAEESARRAVEITDPPPPPQVPFDGWQALGLVARSRDLAESTDYFGRALLVAERARLPTAHAYAMIRFGGNAWLADGDVSGLERARREATRLGLVVMVYNIDANLALHEVLDGRFAPAAELLDQCWPAASRLRLAVICRHLLATRATLYGHQARRAEMDEALAELRHWGADQEPEWSLTFGLARTFCALLEEDGDTARQELARAGAIEAEHPTAYHLAGGRGLGVLLGVLDGEFDWQDYAALTAGAASRMRWNAPYTLLARAVLLGRAGRPEAAADAAAAAATAASRYGMARHLATRLVAEEAHAGGWADGVSALREAEEYFHGAGIPAVASACRALLRQLGAPVQQRRSGTDRVPRALRALGVTIREFEVLELLVRQLTNKAIADRLHISPRTVEKHVASLIMKTNQPDRSAIVDYASGLLA